MEKHSIDKIVKNHLIDRSIEPTGNAWDRLDSMLTTAEEKPKNKRNIIWLFILAAASFVSIIMVMIHVVYNDHQSLTGRNNGLIIAESSQPSPEPKVEIISPNKVIVDSESKINIVDQTTIKLNFSKESKILGGFNKVSNEFQSIVNFESNHENLELVTNITEVEKGLNILSVDENMTQTSTLKINADRLLANIENPNSTFVNTSHKQAQIVTTSKIDPNKLLREAENDVNEKFMHKIFKNLQETTVQVLTSVSQRNEEK